MNPVDSSPLIRHLESLAEAEGDHTEELLRYLTHADVGVREAAVWGLLGNSRDDVCPPLLKVAEEDADEGVRAAAIFVLGHLVYDRQVYADSDDASPGPEVERAESYLREVLLDPDSPTLLKRRALEGLSFIDEEGIEGIIDEWSRSEDELFRKSAAFAMGRADVDRFHKSLLRLLDDPSEMVVLEAMRSTGEQGLKQACSRLGRLARGAQQNLALEAIQSLGQIGGSSSETTLKAVIREGNEERRALAREMLAELRGEE